MAEESSVTRSLVRVEISETSLVDLKQFVTEKGGRVIVGGKCLCFYYTTNKCCCCCCAAVLMTIY